MAFCSNCGINVDPNSMFCVKCGARVQVVDEQFDPALIDYIIKSRKQGYSEPEICRSLSQAGYTSGTINAAVAKSFKSPGEPELPVPPPTPPSPAAQIKGLLQTRLEEKKPDFVSSAVMKIIIFIIVIAFYWYLITNAQYQLEDVQACLDSCSDNDRGCLDGCSKRNGECLDECSKKADICRTTCSDSACLDTCHSNVEMCLDTCGNNAHNCIDECSNNECINACKEKADQSDILVPEPSTIADVNKMTCQANCRIDRPICEDACGSGSTSGVCKDLCNAKYLTCLSDC